MSAISKHLKRVYKLKNPNNKSKPVLINTQGQYSRGQYSRDLRNYSISHVVSQSSSNALKETLVNFVITSNSRFIIV